MPHFGSHRTYNFGSQTFNSFVTLTMIPRFILWAFIRRPRGRLMRFASVIIDHAYGPVSVMSSNRNWQYSYAWALCVTANSFGTKICGCRVSVASVGRHQPIPSPSDHHSSSPLSSSNHPRISSTLRFARRSTRIWCNN